MQEFRTSRYTAAKILGTTPAAVTNYLENRRGDKYAERIMGEAQLKELVRRAAQLLLKMNERNGGGRYDGFREYHMVMCMICSRVNEVAIERGCPATFFMHK